MWRIYNWRFSGRASSQRREGRYGLGKERQGQGGRSGLARRKFQHLIILRVSTSTRNQAAPYFMVIEIDRKK